MSGPNGPPPPEQHSWLRILIVMTPFLIAVSGWVMTQFSALEKQIYEAKATYVTREELNSIVTRLEGSLTLQLARIENRIVDSQTTARREVDGVNEHLIALDTKLTKVLEARGH